ncbi:MAG: hypothetical protein HY397_02370 [Candidatus Doudnabacteria bacterium]|nr:hypothetical protein [Candidatus Doudnabacteria bacterium]
MKSRKKYSDSIQVAKTVLKVLGATGLVASVLVFPGLAYMYDWLYKTVGTKDVRARYNFNRLQKRGLIKIRQRGKKIQVILTEKGRRRALRGRIEDLKISKQKNWDGFWRLVMFDVPEAGRTARDLIRHKLRQLGFIAIQKSVFIHAFPCADVIDFLRVHYRLHPGQLYVFDSKVTEGEHLLRKHFRV